MTDRQARLLDLSATKNGGRFLTAEDIERSFDCFTLGTRLPTMVDISQNMDRSEVMELRTLWQEPGGWYHTDETWTDRVGPFETQEAAQQALNKYARELLGILGLGA